MEKCEGCRERATSICVCTFPWPQFCPSCGQIHLSSPQQHHSLEPVAAKAFLYSPGALPAYYDRQFIVSKTLDYIQQTREEAKHCEEQLEELIHTIQRKVEEWISTTRGQMQAVRTGVEREAAEMERTVQSMRYQERGGGRELEEVLERLGREEVETIREKVRLVQYEFKPYLLTTALADLFSVTLLPSPLHSTPHLLHFPSESQLLFKYNFHDRTLSRHKHSLHFNSGAAWCVLSARFDFLYSGGHHNSQVTQEAYNISGEEATRTGDMLSGRFLHTLVGLEGVGYALGGNGGAGGMRGCEEYRRETGKWARIADMNEGRFGATGCAYKEAVYVAGGVKSNKAEVYHPQVNSFTLLALTLPSNDKFTVSLIVSDTLLLLQDAAMYQWSLTQPNKALVQLCTLPRASNWHSPLHPFLYQSYIYFLRSDYELWKIAAGSSSLELIVSFL